MEKEIVHTIGQSRLLKMTVELLHKKLLSMIIMLIISTMLLSSQTIVNVNNFNDLETAIENFNSGTEDITITVTSPDIKIENNLSITNATAILTITGSNSIFTLTRGEEVPSASNGLFMVENEATLIIENITITGNKRNVSDNFASLVHVNKGNLILKEGAKLRNNLVINRPGSGVHIENGGTFTMSGGEISDNEAQTDNNRSRFFPSYNPGDGSGVCVESDGIFTMIGGEITRNKSQSGSGVCVNEGGTFIMIGGKINYNEESSYGSVCVQNGGKFTMNNGEISDNKGGGGVWVFGDGEFNMYGGEISRNNGGGVRGGTFTMSGGAIIGNEGTIFGGGATVIGGTFTMSGDAVIRDNKSVNGGGGVHVDEGATFIMNGGEISGNQARSEGGGVYVGNRVSVPRKVCKMYLGGNAVIRNNTTSSMKLISLNSTGSAANNVFLNNYIINERYTSNGIFIELGSPALAPESGMEVWVQQTYSPLQNPIVSGATFADLEYFHSDDLGKDVIFVNDRLWIVETQR